MSQPRTLSCGVLVINPSGELLLGHTTGAGHWDIPKGVGEAGETPAQTAARELREDTGLGLSPDTLLDVGPFAYRRGKDLRLYAALLARSDVSGFECTSRFRDRRGRLRPEFDAFEWTPFEHVPERCAASMAHVLTTALSLSSVREALLAAPGHTLGDRFLATAHALADGARAESMRWFRAPIAVDFKADRSPVTQADRAVESMLRARLAEWWPEHAIAGEEFGGETTGAEFVWVIDPIDGTKSYVSGLPLWGTLIGLLHLGTPVLGLVDSPATAERWIATPSAGAWYQRTGFLPRRCSTSGCTDLGAARLCLPSPDEFGAGDARRIRQLTERAALCRYGGDCYAYAMLAAGHIDLIVESGLEAHDYLPLVPVVEQAGGAITDWSGMPLTSGSSGDVLASATRGLHTQVLPRLSSARR
jgi:histidinol-phosphatase